MSASAGGINYRKFSEFYDTSNVEVFKKLTFFSLNLLRGRSSEVIQTTIQGIFAALTLKIKTNGKEIPAAERRDYVLIYKEMHNILVQAILKENAGKTKEEIQERFLSKNSLELLDLIILNKIQIIFDEPDSLIDHLIAEKVPEKEPTVLYELYTLKAKVEELRAKYKVAADKADKDVAERRAKKTAKKTASGKRKFTSDYEFRF